MPRRKRRPSEPPIPRPATIRKRCLEIQAGWTDAERARRQVGFHVRRTEAVEILGWSVPVYAAEELVGEEQGRARY